MASVSSGMVVISEPEQLIGPNEFSSLYLKPHGETSFIICSNKRDVCCVTTTSLREVKILYYKWMISLTEFGYSNDYVVNDRYYKKEIFLDMMKMFYPEHLEWIMWHPEWLK